MAKLTKEEADQLAALRAKEEAPDEEPDDGAGGDDGHVIVLRGSRADSFLEALLGPATKPRGRDTKQQPAKTQRKQKDVDDQADGDDGDDGQADVDPDPPQRTNRYFR